LIPLCDYNGETTPPDNLVLKGGGEKICLRNRMVRQARKCQTPK
jgi:hypothetical protein